MEYQRATEEVTGIMHFKLILEMSKRMNRSYTRIEKAKEVVSVKPNLEFSSLFLPVCSQPLLLNALIFSVVANF